MIRFKILISIQGRKQTPGSPGADEGNCCRILGKQFSTDAYWTGGGYLPVYKTRGKNLLIFSPRFDGDKDPLKVDFTTVAGLFFFQSAK